MTLTIFAVLFVLIAISDFLRPFHLFPNDGFVFLGTKLTGTANAVMGPLFGIIIIVSAYGIWAMRKFTLPIAYVFVLCVILNMILYAIKNGATRPLPIANVVIGIGVPLALAIILHRRRADLGDRSCGLVSDVKKQVVRPEHRLYREPARLRNGFQHQHFLHFAERCFEMDQR